MRWKLTLVAVAALAFGAPADVLRGQQTIRGEEAEREVELEAVEPGAAQVGRSPEVIEDVEDEAPRERAPTRGRSQTLPNRVPPQADLPERVRPQEEARAPGQSPAATALPAAGGADVPLPSQRRAAPGGFDDRALARLLAAEVRAGADVARAAVERSEQAAVRRLAEQAIADYDRILGQLDAATRTVETAPPRTRDAAPPADEAAEEAAAEVRRQRRERAAAVAERDANPLSDRSEGVVQAPREREDDPSAATYRDVQTQSDTLPVNPNTEAQRDVEAARRRQQDERPDTPRRATPDVPRQPVADAGAGRSPQDAVRPTHLWVGLHDALAERSASSERALLGRHEGAAFDRVFLGLQLARSQRLADTMAVLETARPPELEPVLEASRAQVERHAAAAGDLLGRLAAP